MNSQQPTTRSSANTCWQSLHCPRSFKVTDFYTNQKRIMRFPIRK